MLTALVALVLLHQTPSTPETTAPAAVTTPAAEPPVPNAAVAPPAATEEPAVPTENPTTAPTKAETPAAPADEYEDIPPPFAAGPAAVGAGATALGFVAGGLCCGAACLVPFAVVPYVSLFTPCVACPPILGAGALGAVGSTVGAVWEFMAGNKRPLVWARLAAPPAVGMALMIPGVVLAFLGAAMSLVSLVALGGEAGFYALFAGLWLASAVMLVGLLVGAAGAMGTYAGLVVYDARKQE